MRAILHLLFGVAWASHEWRLPLDQAETAASDLPNRLKGVDAADDSSKALGRLLLALSPAAEARLLAGHATLDAVQPVQPMQDRGSPSSLAEMDDQAESFMKTFMQQTQNVAMKASFSSIIGFCTGYALKQAGRAMAVAVGVIFLFLTALEVKGYITVNWGKIKEDTFGKMDLDGDGEVDINDAKLALQMFVHYCTKGGAVSHVTFTAWLLYGLKHG